MKMKTRRKHKGLLSVELVVAISVLAVIIGVLLSLNLSFGKLKKHLWAKHTCYTAGQAQMDAIAATGGLIPENTFNKLWPGVNCTIQISDGYDRWQGLQKIDLTLSKKIKQKVVQIRLTRYLPLSSGGNQ